jgi:hypothetical protein
MSMAGMSCTGENLIGCRRAFFEIQRLGNTEALKHRGTESTERWSLRGVEILEGFEVFSITQVFELRSWSFILR